MKFEGTTQEWELIVQKFPNTQLELHNKNLDFFF